MEEPYLETLTLDNWILRNPSGPEHLPISSQFSPKALWTEPRLVRYSTFSGSTWSTGVTMLWQGSWTKATSRERTALQGHCPDSSCLPLSFVMQIFPALCKIGLPQPPFLILLFSFLFLLRFLRFVHHCPLKPSVTQKL